ncbi:hypothetical protein [Salinarimonas ramus]|uniref:Molybdopterin molybdenumtransferase n=1 Tax=Salinarimonas ramus TaxID=690164 RepID=A0A917Q9S5_9HYPH|nr:hypothetical protein [Salinarimonas ramus]GGK38927.1 hypothetical protein GCM10011322_27510 [Salinarimonas ramus]
MLGLPGNPVSALVSFLLLGEAALAALEGRRARPRIGYPLRLVEPFARRPGRPEFATACLVETADGLAAAIVGRGGSARLRPLAEADGLAEIAPNYAPVRAGDRVVFHPFATGRGLGL